MEERYDLRNIPVGRLYGIGKAKETAYNNMGVYSVHDLLYFFPRAYENRGQICLLCESKREIKNAVILTVATEPKISLIRRGMSLLKFRAFDESGTCEITYFNQNYLKDKFPIGSTFRFWGKIELEKGRYYMTSPVAEAYSEEVSLPPFSPVYRLTEGLSQKTISQHIASALTVAIATTDPLPEEIREREELCTLHFALRQIHTPNDGQSLAIAKRRLIFDEFFTFAAGMQLSARRIVRGRAFACKDIDIEPFLSLLPYSLTDAQERTIREVLSDMGRPEPMSRIIVGDVGCGKTVCAAAAMYAAVRNGRQAALMAPTEILATQHYNDLMPLFSALGIRTVLLTGSLTPANKRKIHAALSSPDSEKRVDVVIGTQALLSEGVEFFAPGLIVTDEQHRFGVFQRAALSEKNDHEHMLVMSATPIPRSLALVMYGDLAMSRIDTMPPGRQRVDTFFVDESYRARLDAFIKKQVDMGGQVYIVCPAVEEKETEDDEVSLYELEEDSFGAERKKAPLKAAVKYARELGERLAGYNIAFIHGRMKTAEKDAVMRDFAENRVQILVSTTVIEVGVNVPNACLMIVENAERFGLSQLHQLRGRVGRGQRKSYCILVSGTESKEGLGQNARRRLETMCSSYDGFEIAEEDLKLRGPGDFLAAQGQGGIRQSGAFGFRLADACEDSELMKTAFDEAKAFVAKDITLEGSPELREEIEAMFTVKGDIIS